MISFEDSIPTRSAAGLAARDLFFDQFNDVNFFIEDEDEENLYQAILGRFFPKLKITQIFPLAGKQNVISHASDPVNSSRAGRSVYIVDKDFDDLLGHKIYIANLFYLEKYSIENYFLEEDAVVEIALESSPKIDLETLRATISFSTFYKKSVNDLSPLFRLFFAVQRFNLGMKNCDIKCESFSVSGQPWKIDAAKIAAYEVQVRDLVTRAAVFRTDGEFSDFLGSVFPTGAEKDVNIAGKYLVSLTYHYLRSVVALGNVTNDSLRYRLATKVSFGGLTGVIGQIEHHLGISR